ncbi:indole-3-glycerol phosphate synthase TrpC [Metabacillus sp. GX 13764]|uniref:indole-3-glycerol phosphate synthase TrpC n=1 Tax=Metabacillus kandeliae TaxID=2900151 RepID=UPI001E62744C|nr:indole-3-glycerol phosphate synthase TrpC [Metabacillus kandeliae]MCD7033370.1 indole-3-glycerol phosphate synthase TrpC [Metabacillus kandeliae]
MLDKILDYKKEEVAKLVLPEDADLPVLSFENALKRPNRRLGLIAEVKKASPSKGLIKEDFHPVSIASQYEAGGADCISVLTDERFFQGKRDFLSEVKRNTRIPVMRKDFIISSIQVRESKRIGADAILLIGEALEAKRLHELYLEAKEEGMEALVEVHSANVLEKILNVFTPAVIGVNNRNLATFKTDLSQLSYSADLMPEGSIIVSESGIHTNEDLLQVEKYGAKAVLVGESLMRQSDQREAILNLFGENANEQASH